MTIRNRSRRTDVKMAVICRMKISNQIFPLYKLYQLRYVMIVIYAVYEKTVTEDYTKVQDGNGKFELSFT